MRHGQNSPSPSPSDGGRQRGPPDVSSADGGWVVHRYEPRVHVSSRLLCHVRGLNLVSSLVPGPVVDLGLRRPALGMVSAPGVPQRTGQWVQFRRSRVPPPCPVPRVAPVILRGGAGRRSLSPRAPSRPWCVVRVPPLSGCRRSLRRRGVPPRKGPRGVPPVSWDWEVSRGHRSSRTLDGAPRCPVLLV